MAEAREPKKFNWGCCILKVIGVFMLLGLIIGGVVITMVIRSASWATNAAEATPATYPPLVIAAGEREDVDRVLQKLQAAENNKTLIDETVTDNVFNGVVDEILKGERAKGKGTEWHDFRLTFEGDHFHVRTTIEPGAKNGNSPGNGMKFINADVIFDLDVADGKVNELAVQKVTLAGKEPPYLAQKLITTWIDAMKQGFKQNNPQGPDLSAFKLVKREGPRVHVIIDPSKFDDMEKSFKKQGATPGASAPKTEPEKTDF